MKGYFSSHRVLNDTIEEGKKVTKKRLIGYNIANKQKRTIIITDHIRKLKRERGYSMKENMDKWIEYTVELRNFCHFTFVHIVHLNRSISNIERLKFNGEYIYPTGEDVKDSGNLSEECDYLLTLFNPTDEKYGLTTHFGYVLEEYPNYRSIHLVESRDTECPQHLAVQMKGKLFQICGLPRFGSAFMSVLFSLEADCLGLHEQGATDPNWKQSK